MRIVSVPGRKVMDPVTRRWVDGTGIDVDPNDLEWARVLAAGDVVEATEPDPSEQETGPSIPAPSAPSQEPQA